MSSKGAGTFIVSDIHGDYYALFDLLAVAGLVSPEDGTRTTLGERTCIVSIGDLCNAVLEDVNGDEMCLLQARDWFDALLVGNHEWPYVHNTSVFSGFYDHAPVASLYRQMSREYFVLPSMLIGETLITHAGWAFPFCETAREAHELIQETWDNYPHCDKPYLLDGIGISRGGRDKVGGILWSDWTYERKSKKFSQVVGHTPIKKGPMVWQRLDDTFTINIDTGCKGGGYPTGLWLDAEGKPGNWVNETGTFPTFTDKEATA